MVYLEYNELKKTPYHSIISDFIFFCKLFSLNSFNMAKKGFTLIELMVVIAIIGLLAMVVTNFDFNKKTDIEKRDRLVQKIESMLQTSKLAMLSGKGINVT